MIVEIYGFITVQCLFMTVWCWVDWQGLPWRCRCWDRSVSPCSHRVEELCGGTRGDSPGRELGPSATAGEWLKQKAGLVEGFAHRSQPSGVHTKFKTTSCFYKALYGCSNLLISCRVIKQQLISLEIWGFCTVLKKNGSESLPVKWHLSGKRALNVCLEH